MGRLGSTQVQGPQVYSCTLLRTEFFEIPAPPQKPDPLIKKNKSHALSCTPCCSEVEPGVHAEPQSMQPGDDEILARALHARKETRKSQAEAMSKHTHTPHTTHTLHTHTRARASLRAGAHSGRCR